jgi:hypothetical protein
MLGFFIGTACLIGLIATVRRGRRFRHFRSMGGPRFYLRRVFGWLGTSTSQEKVLVGAAEELRESFDQARGQVFASRADLAEALRKPSFDPESLGEVFARHDEALRHLREVATSAMARVHEALDEKQRIALAGMLENGMRRGYRGRSPYRGGVAI